MRFLFVLGVILGSLGLGGFVFLDPDPTPEGILLLSVTLLGSALIMLDGVLAEQAKTSPLDTAMTQEVDPTDLRKPERSPSRTAQPSENQTPALSQGR